MDDMQPDRFWSGVFSKANRDTYRMLFGEQEERVMIAILLFCIYVAILWQFSSPGMAKDEIILKSAATAAPLLVYPFLLISNFFKATKRTYQELHIVHRSLTDSLKGCAKFEILLIQEDNRTVGRVTNVGNGDGILSIEIDYSEADLDDAPRRHVEAHWSDGYFFGQRGFNEGVRNEFLLRDIQADFERFYGGVGGRANSWYGLGINKRRKISILANASPRPPGGVNRIVIETCGEGIKLVSGDAKIYGQKEAP